MRLGELAAELDGRSKGTLRARLDDLVALGAVAKRGRGMPYAVWSELTGVGRDLAGVVDLLDRWLSRAPKGPVPVGGVTAKATIRALVEGWESTILHVLAAEPRSLDALDRVIYGVNYPALERRLAALRSADLVEPTASGPERPYRIGPWGRESVQSLAAAVSFERAHMATATVPLTPADEEALSLLASAS